MALKSSGCGKKQDKTAYYHICRSEWSHSESYALEAKQCTLERYLPPSEVLAKIKRNQFQVRTLSSGKLIKP